MVSLSQGTFEEHETDTSTSAYVCDLVLNTPFLSARGSVSSTYFFLNKEMMLKTHLVVRTIVAYQLQQLRLGTDGPQLQLPSPLWYQLRTYQIRTHQEG